MRLYSSSADLRRLCLSQKKTAAIADIARTTPTTAPAAIAVVFEPPPEPDDESLDELLGAGVAVIITVLPGETLVTIDGVGRVCDGVPDGVESLVLPPKVGTLSVVPVRYTL